MPTRYTAAIAALEPSPMVIGDMGSAVAHLQSALAALGYYTAAVDGQYGRATQSAMIQFQHYHGLKETGSYDADAWYALSFWVNEEHNWPSSGTFTLPEALRQGLQVVSRWLRPLRDRPAG